MLESMIAAFHQRFGHPVARLLTEVQEVPYRTRRFRMDRIKEEAQELLDAIEQGILYKIAREAADLIYVVIGTLLVFGLPFDAIFRIVHEANMAKEPHPDGEFGKPIKPAGWQSPDEEIQALINDGRAYRAMQEKEAAQAAALPTPVAVDPTPVVAPPPEAPPEAPPVVEPAPPVVADPPADPVAPPAVAA